MRAAVVGEEYYEPIALRYHVGVKSLLMRRIPNCALVTHRRNCLRGILIESDTVAGRAIVEVDGAVDA